MPETMHQLARNMLIHIQQKGVKSSEAEFAYLTTYINRVEAIERASHNKLSKIRRALAQEVPIGSGLELPPLGKRIERILG